MSLLLFGGGEPLSSARARVRIHAHVQGAVGAKGKAALRVVELRRRDAEVEQHAVDLRRQRRQLREPGLHEREARIGFRTLVDDLGIDRAQAGASTARRSSRGGGR